MELYSIVEHDISMMGFNSSILASSVHFERDPTKQMHHIVQYYETQLTTYNKCMLKIL